MAIGTYDVLVERIELGAEGILDLRFLLGQHANRPSYQKQLTIEGAVRLDVDGMPAGLVTEEQRTMATKKLARLKAKAAKARDGK
jgi:sRNA-binding protein